MIKTLRLILAPLRTDQASGPYLQWINDPAVNCYLESRFTHYVEDDLRTYIERANADPAVHLFGMFLRDGGDHIGNIKLGPVNEEHARGDIGLVLWKPAWGQGFGTEVIACISRFAFDTLGLHKVTAGCYDYNNGAARAFLKAGFTREGVLRRHYRCDGVWIDGILFGLIAENHHA